MNKNILSFVIATIMAAQVFAGDEAKPATEACDKPVAKESCDKPENLSIAMSVRPYAKKHARKEKQN